MGGNPLVPTRRLLTLVKQPDFPAFFDSAAKAASNIDPASNYTRVTFSRGEDQIIASSYWNRLRPGLTTHRVETRIGEEHLLAAYQTEINGDRLVDAIYENQEGYSEQQLLATALAAGSLLTQYEAAIS